MTAMKLVRLWLWIWYATHTHKSLYRILPAMRHQDSVLVTRSWNHLRPESVFRIQRLRKIWGPKGKENEITKHVTWPSGHWGWRRPWSAVSICHMAGMFLGISAQDVPGTSVSSSWEYLAPSHQGADQGRPLWLDNLLILTGLQGANSGSTQLLAWTASKSYMWGPRPWLRWVLRIETKHFTVKGPLLF